MRAGALFAVIYLGLAGYVLYDAFTCRYMMCGFKALVVFVPAGFVFVPIYQALDRVFIFPIPANALWNWFVIVPTVLTNAALAYVLGAFAERFWRRRSA